MMVEKLCPYTLFCATAVQFLQRAWTNRFASGILADPPTKHAHSAVDASLPNPTERLPPVVEDIFSSFTFSFSDRFFVWRLVLSSRAGFGDGLERESRTIRNEQYTLRVA